jgi:GH24 family phage-related lysozyme (muramidase)
MNTIKITDELKARIRDHEGCVDTVYLDDTLGKATIGIGHLVQPHERQRFKEGVKISTDEIEDLFLIDLNRACAGAEQLISENYKADKRLPQAIEHVIVEMVFQLGKTGVSKFKKMWRALSDGDRKQASLEMQDSRWHSQTPVRCEALAEIVANA